jgi:hypothetical protein
MAGRPSIPPPRSQAPRQAPESLLLFLLVVCLMVTLGSLFWAHNPAANLFAPITESQANPNR